MTVICYRSGVLATDSGAFSYDVFCAFVKKAYKTLDGALHASVGPGADAVAFTLWMEDGRRKDNKPTLAENFSALVVEASGQVKQFDHNLNYDILDAPFHAIGSGGEIAIGAMAHGASAVDAVAIALEWCVSVRGPIQMVWLDAHAAEPVAPVAAAVSDAAAIVPADDDDWFALNDAYWGTMQEDNVPG